MKTLVILAAPTAALATVGLAQTVNEGGRKFTTALTGEAEVTAAGVPNQGDLDGTGTASVTVNVGQSRVCYSLEVDDIAEATAAHIHEAPATTTGGVVVPLAAPADGDSAGCVEGINKDLAKRIISHPQNFYVNVHNADFPNGALRGQLR
jgi:hypothetical protein